MERIVREPWEDAIADWMERRRAQLGETKEAFAARLLDGKGQPLARATYSILAARKRHVTLLTLVRLCRAFPADAAEITAMAMEGKDG